MSKNITIQEGGKGYPFGPVKCLMVEGDNGEFYPWYPEDDRALDSLSVDKNGIYRASDRGVYGWNRVSVNVAQTDRVTGRDPETGEEKTVTSDPDTGELVETVVPTEIWVTTLPTKTEYTHGETIDYSGIVVHAYSATGQDMGAVPFNELVFPETIADAQKTDGWSDGHGLNAMQITYTPHWSWYINSQGKFEVQVYVHGTPLGTLNGAPISYGGNGPATILITRYNGTNYGASIAGGSQATHLYMYMDTETAGGWTFQAGSTQAAGDHRFTEIAWSDYITAVPASSVDPTTVDPDNLHATQSLPVQWQRPGDGAVLETTFNITVTGGN